MSIATEIIDAFKGDVSTVRVNKHADLHGEDATEVKVDLIDGRRVIGTFATESKPGFGGVEFSSTKDIPGLMKAKIKAVLEGKAE